jgi:hypothetical protein
MSDEAEQPLRFKAKRRTKAAEVEEEDGSITKVVLKEMMGTDRDAYQELVAGKVKRGKDGLPVSGTKGMTTELIARHAFAEDGKPLSKRIIDNWPSSCQLMILKECMELSGLGGDEAKEAAKND